VLRLENQVWGALARGVKKNRTEKNNGDISHSEPAAVKTAIQNEDPVIAGVGGT